MHMEKEKLTPLYNVVCLSSTKYWENWREQYVIVKGSHPTFTECCTVPINTAEEAQKIVNEYEVKNIPAYAYHYGFKERGFNNGEEQCTKLCWNKQYMDYIQGMAHV